MQGESCNNQVWFLIELISELEQGRYECSVFLTIDYFSNLGFCCGSELALIGLRGH